MKLLKSAACVGCGLSCLAGAWLAGFVGGMSGKPELLIPAAGMLGGALFMGKEAVVALLPEKRDV